MTLPPASDPTTLAVLFVVAMLAACFDAIAGGGGLITLPALLLAGLDPLAALATNKLQASGSAASAAFAFARHGLIRMRDVRTFGIIAVCAGAIGACAASALPRQLLAALVPLVLVGVAIYFAFARRPSEEDSEARMSRPVFAATLCVAVGFYDGIFGPGTGAFLLIGFVTLLGLGLVRANAQTKLANAASNLGALAVFVATGHVFWSVGVVMAVGAIIGARIGARLAIRHGARIIRPLVVVVCCALAARLAAEPTNPLRQAVSALMTHMRS